MRQGLLGLKGHDGDQPEDETKGGDAKVVSEKSV
jgi:hypothetical protein